MTRRRAARVRGITEFRAFLRRIPQSARLEIIDLLDDGGGDVRDFMRALAPFRSGALMAGISSETMEGTLRAKVGIWRKAERRRLFYGHILNAGRLGYARPVTRVRNGKLQRYVMNISPIAPMNFLPSADEASGLLRPRLGQVWRNILFDVASQAGGAPK